MKIKTLLPLALALVLSVGCDKNKVLGIRAFDVSNAAVIVVPAGTPAGALVALPPGRGAVE